jgi:hypothetical protein
VLADVLKKLRQPVLIAVHVEVDGVVEPDPVDPELVDPVEADVADELLRAAVC